MSQATLDNIRHIVRMETMKANCMLRPFCPVGHHMF